ncbi:MAG: selenide, water dikinase SelD [Jhaorihella sp.]
MNSHPVRLSAMAHGGGCGCKLDPALLHTILSGLPGQIADPAMLVGLETKDDAIVYRLDDERAVVATTDFFMPMVDDPREFGAIAAANALSDVYAVGGRPLFALAVAGMPAGKLPAEVIGQILAGGAEMAAKAGIIVGGGHSIDCPEPVYGLAVVGLVHPDRVKRNCTARAGDVLILGKPLGVGILSNAFKNDRLSADGYGELIATTTRLNSIGAELGEFDSVHAMTDVTGFGLLGHLMEICAGSGLGAEIDMAQIPLLASAVPLAREGLQTGAGRRNRESVGDGVAFFDGIAEWQRNLLSDPQTSGGILASVAAEDAPHVLELFHRQGYAGAAIIGRMHEGEARIRVRP